MGKNKSYFYIGIAVTFWASSPSVAKICLKNLDSIQLMFFMFLIASVSLFLILLFMGKIIFLKNYSISDYIHFSLMGFIGIFSYFFFLLNSFVIINVQEAYIINYTWPIWMILFTFFLLKSHISMKNIFSLLLGFLGMFIIIMRAGVLNFSLENSKGYLFALMSAILYGLFSAMAKKENREPLTSMFFYFSFAFLFSSVLFANFSYIPSFSFMEIIGLIWLGLGSCGLGFLFWFKAIHHGNPLELANFVYLTPILSLIIIYFLIEEFFQIQAFIGLCFILFAIFINKLGISENKNKKQKKQLIKI